MTTTNQVSETDLVEIESALDAVTPKGWGPTVTVEQAFDFRESAFAFVPKLVRVARERLAELDPREISVDALKADGWAEPSSDSVFWTLGNLEAAVSSTEGWRVWHDKRLTNPIPKTMGGLRTISRQSSTTSTREVGNE